MNPEDNTLRVWIERGSSKGARGFDLRASQRALVGRSLDATQLDEDMVPIEFLDATVSHRAALIEFTPNGWKIRNLSKTNQMIVQLFGKAALYLETEREGRPEQSCHIDDSAVVTFGSAGGPSLALTRGPIQTEFDGGNADVEVPAKRSERSRWKKSVLAATGLSLAATLVGVGLWSVHRSKLEEHARRLEAAIEQDSSDDERYRAQLAATSAEIQGLRSEQAALMTAARKATKSVWQVGIRNKVSKAFQAMGTGFVVRDPRGQMVMATNAHVAAGLASNADKFVRVANEQGSAPGLRRVDLEFVAFRSESAAEGERDLYASLSPDAVVHPGYEEWSGNSFVFTEGVAGNVQGNRRVSPYDVAYFKIEDDPSTACVPLELGELSPSAVAASVAVVGFPMEGVGTPSAVAQSSFGAIRAVTDYFGGVAAGQELLIHHDCRTLGGSSGSPVIDAKGRVVGVNFAGSYAFPSGSSGGVVRVPLGIAYAGSVVFLDELLKGTAETALKARNEVWLKLRVPKGKTTKDIVDQLLKSLDTANLIRARQVEFTNTSIESLDLPDDLGAYRIELIADDLMEFDARIVSRGLQIQPLPYLPGYTVFRGVPPGEVGIRLGPGGGSDGAKRRVFIRAVSSKSVDDILLSRSLQPILVVQGNFSKSSESASSQSKPVEQMIRVDGDLLRLEGGRRYELAVLIGERGVDRSLGLVVPDTLKIKIMRFIDGSGDQLAPAASWANGMVARYDLQIQKGKFASLRIDIGGDQRVGSEIEVYYRLTASR